MGYLTDFEFSDHKNDDNVSAMEIAKKMKQIMNETKGAFYPFERGINNILLNPNAENWNSISLEAYECKWYEFNEDMCKLSALVPNVIFKLHGKGEEWDDIWDAYYKGGKSVIHQAKIVIDPLDEKEFG